MILQCPNCSTQFNVPDGAIPAEGRRVKCASCAHKWLAKPTDGVRPAPPSPAPPNTAPVRQKRRRPAGAPAARRPQPAPEAPDDLEQDAALASQHIALRKQLADNQHGDIPADDTPLAGIGDDDFDEPASARPDSGDPTADEGGVDDDLDFMSRVSAGLAKSGVDPENHASDVDASDILANISDAAAKTNTPGFLARFDITKTLYQAGWGSLLVFWLGLIGLVAFGGETLTSVWPASSQIYASVSGMSDVERIKASAETLSPAITDEPEMLSAGLYTDPDPTSAPSYRWETDENGDNYLVLTLILKNDGRRAATVRKLQVVFVNQKSEPIGRWIVDPPGRILTRGSFLKFDVRRKDYPVGIYSVVVTIVEGSRSEGEAFQSR